MRIVHLIKRCNRSWASHWVAVIAILGSLNLLFAAQPETLYPWALDYYQTFTSKLGILGCGTDIGVGTRSVDEVLAEIICRENITRGIPQIMYLVGYQEYGHDGSYPDIGRINPYLKRAQDANAPAALEWLLKEGLKHNTSVSFHTNLRDAYEAFPLYNAYKEKGCILSTDGVWCNRQAYAINLNCDWTSGLAKQRIDDLMSKLPGLSNSKTIHSDTYMEGAGIDDAGRTSISAYWRQTYGVDITSECPTLPGVVAFGWHFDRWGYSVGDQFNVPSYISCGGDDGLAELGKSLSDVGWTNDDVALTGKFCMNTLPWYYLNRLIRISRNGSTITFSNNVISTPTTITRNGEFLRQDNDLFIPALWRKNREIMSYSANGFTNRLWALPPEWKDVTALDIYKITRSGLQKTQSNIAVANGRVSFSLPGGQGASIVPAGTDPNVQPVVPPSGTATYLATNTTIGGSWQGAYGNVGYDVIGASSNIPSSINMSYIGGTNTTWAATTADTRALQNPSNPSTRIAAGKTTPNHMVVDIDVGSATQEVNLYFVDWQNTGCRMAIDVMDLNNFKSIDTKIVSKFQSGVFLQYQISGHVWFRITRLPGPSTWTGPNAVLSGVFFSSTQPPAFSRVNITPENAIVKPSATQQFAGQAVDQYGRAMSTQPTSFTWIVSGGGTISPSGLFTAASTEDGPFTVTANGTLGDQSKDGTTSVSISARTVVAAINAGGSAIGSFAADQNYAGGSIWVGTTGVNTTGVANAALPDVYLSERHGNFSYTIPGLTAGSQYTVRLHFAETYFTAAGSRVFNVSINSVSALVNYDVFAAAGAKDKAVVRDFSATASSAGQIVINFVSVTDNAKISGIEIISGGSTAINYSAQYHGLSALSNGLRIYNHTIEVLGARHHSLSIVNVAGATVQRFSGEGKKVYKIQNGMLGKGTYFVIANIDEKNMRQRIIVQ